MQIYVTKVRKRKTDAVPKHWQKSATGFNEKNTNDGIKTYDASTRPLTIKFLYGGRSNSAVDNTSNV